ncbi:TetR/AcrR family transcriptional regulator [Xanthomonas hyacinthi]|uniref:TetR/AcrR family transcriptional regulator n=1 Tax=Xanthomonas hyacinthi TaxID=56455 RepID=UPI00065A74A1|nr:TetR/AcrR family transcriptional regulator [Xanthomonas hyacinthi]KLD75648.1 hypothetical protein Y886_25810 [Xanthomonas hyacinthi DSM 19077]
MTNVKVKRDYVKVKRDAATSRALILDAAERLFAENGFDGVPMRTISSGAGIGLGLLTYHFPAKEALLEAVIARRAGSLKDAQFAAFARLSPSDTLEDVMDAFTRPILELMSSGDPGWRAYGQLIAVLEQQRRWMPLLQAYFRDIGFAAMERISIAEPRLDKAAGLRAFSCFISVIMGAFAINGGLDIISDGRMASEDLRAAYPTMMRFVVGGFRALTD